MNLGRPPPPPPRSNPVMSSHFQSRATPRQLIQRVFRDKHGLVLNSTCQALSHSYPVRQDGGLLCR